MVRDTWQVRGHPAWVASALFAILHVAGCGTHSRPCPPGDAGSPGSPPVEVGQPPSGHDLCQGQLGADGCWPSTVTCADGHQPTTPVDYGRCALDRALAEAHSTAMVQVAVVGDAALAGGMETITLLLDARPESYVIASRGDVTWIVGRDAVGAMYGALEI